MKIASFLVLILLFFSSCNPNRNVLFVTFDNSENIAMGSPVTLNGHKIGKIERIEFDKKFRVRMKLRFEEEHKIPDDSKFFIGSEDLFSKAILIHPGSSKKYYTAKDKIVGSVYATDDLDKILDLFSDEFEKSGAKSATDSIVAGINELSKQLEEIEKVDIEIKKRPKK